MKTLNHQYKINLASLLTYQECYTKSSMAIGTEQILNFEVHQSHNIHVYSAPLEKDEIQL